MAKLALLFIGCCLLLAGTASSQEVVITDFPLGVGSSVSPDIVKPYYAELKAISDTLQKYPLTRAIITGGADGEKYRTDNDAKNPGLALGRAHMLREFMIREFGVDSTRLVIQSDDVASRGAIYRYAAIRIDGELSDLERRLNAVENRPPVEKHFTEVREVVSDINEYLGLQFNLGFSSSPFGGIPIAAGSVTWKRIVYVEGLVGHTFWNNSFRFAGEDLDTKRRLVGGHVLVYPKHDLPVGILGGWLRVEEISQKYYEYVKMSEGPVFGLRASLFDVVSLTGVYNPSNHRRAGSDFSDAKNNQFLIYLTAYLAIGGEK